MATQRNSGVAGTMEQRGINALSAIGTLRTGVPSRPTSQGPRPNVVIGQLIVSPAAVRDKLNQVNAQVGTLDSEIRSNVTRAGFLGTWSQFKDNWQKFYDDHQSLAKILITGTGTVDRKANEYQAQLSSWYEALKTENPTARLVFPPPLPPTAPPTGPSVPWWGISLLSILGTGALIYGTYASYLYIREAQAKKRFIEDEVVPRVLSSNPRTAAFARMPTSFSENRASHGTDSPDSYTRMHVAEMSNDPDSRPSIYQLGRLYNE